MTLALSVWLLVFFLGGGVHICVGLCVGGCVGV